MNHYPSFGLATSFVICGHIHSAWRVQKNMFNTGVDSNFMMPVNASRIEFVKNAITNYYDNDVFVANHEANVAHVARGKAGNYFDLEKRTMKHIDMFQYI